MDYTGYISVIQFGRNNNLSHQRIYKLMQAGAIDYVTDYAGRKLIHQDTLIKRKESLKSIIEKTM